MPNPTMSELKALHSTLGEMSIKTVDSMSPGLSGTFMKFYSELSKTVNGKKRGRTRRAQKPTSRRTTRRKTSTRTKAKTKA